MSSMPAFAQRATAKVIRLRTQAQAASSQSCKPHQGIIKIVINSGSHCEFDVVI